MQSPPCECCGMNPATIKYDASGGYLPAIKLCKHCNLSAYENGKCDCNNGAKYEQEELDEDKAA